MASSVLDQLVQSEPSKWPRLTPCGTLKVVAFAAEILDPPEVPPLGADPEDGPAPADPEAPAAPAPAEPEPPDGPPDPGAGAAGVDVGADIVGM